MRASALLMPLVGFACAPVYLAPSAHVPQLKKGDQVTAAAFLGTNGVDGQIAYSPVEQLVVLGSVSGWNESATENHAYAQGGVGWFMPFANEFLHVGTSGGLGYGNSAADGAELFTNDYMFARGKYTRAYGQGHFGLSTDVIDLGVQMRAAYVRYIYDKAPNSNVGRIQHNVFLEPMGYIHLGYRWIKAALQLGFVIPTVKEESRIDTSVIHISLGLVTTFDVGSGVTVEAP